MASTQPRSESVFPPSLAFRFVDMSKWTKNKAKIYPRIYIARQVGATNSIYQKREYCNSRLRCASYCTEMIFWFRTARLWVGFSVPRHILPQHNYKIDVFLQKTQTKTHQDFVPFAKNKQVVE